MTPYDPARHHRRSMRLKGYDYTQPGAYFVTICAQDQPFLFGEVVDGEMHLNEWGEIVHEEWFRTAQLRPYVVLHQDEFVVMPNHVHGIIWIADPPVGATWRVAPTPPAGPNAGSIGAIIGQFKSAVTKRINILRDTPGEPVWQRNYYEPINRTERALNAIRRYIAENPLRWHLDRYNPDATGPDHLAIDVWQTLQADDHAGADDQEATR